MKLNNILLTFFSEFDKDLTENSLINKFNFFLNEIIKYNRIKNITSLKTDKQIIIKHFIDSLQIIKFYNISLCETMLDLGSGAGFPGIPLAIVYPNVNFNLLESNKKKTNFISYIIKELNLDNVQVLNNRAEEIAKNDNYREKYNCCVTRAFSNLSTTFEISASFIKKDGYLCLYSSQEQASLVDKQHNSNFSTLGLKIDHVMNYELPENNGAHSIIFVKKMWKTVDIYPRTINKINKNPLFNFNKNVHKSRMFHVERS